MPAVALVWASFMWSSKCLLVEAALNWVCGGSVLLQAFPLVHPLAYSEHPQLPRQLCTGCTIRNGLRPWFTPTSLG